jgi:hypothetical protein
MFNNGARSQTTQNLNKLFSRELTAKRNIYLCLMAIAVVASGIGGAMIANRVNGDRPGDAPNIASASVMPRAGDPLQKLRMQDEPVNREALISQVWQCQLSWIARVERPETLSTDDLNKLLEQCKAARSGGDR